MSDTARTTAQAPDPVVARQQSWLLLVGLFFCLAAAALKVPPLATVLAILLVGLLPGLLRLPGTWAPGQAWRAAAGHPRQRAAVVAAGSIFAAAAMALAGWAGIGAQIAVAASVPVGAVLGYLAGQRLTAPTGLMAGATLSMFMLLLTGGAGPDQVTRLAISYGVLGLAWGITAAGVGEADRDSSPAGPDTDEPGLSILPLALWAMALGGALGWWAGTALGQARNFAVTLIVAVMWLMPAMIAVLWGELMLAFSDRYLRNRRRKSLAERLRDVR